MIIWENWFRMDVSDVRCWIGGLFFFCCFEQINNTTIVEEEEEEEEERHIIHQIRLFLKEGKAEISLNGFIFCLL